MCAWKAVHCHSLLEKWDSPGSSAGNESACSTGDPSSIPGVERSTTEGIGYPLQYSWASPVAQLVKKSVSNEGDLGSIPGLGRSPGEGNGYPLQYSGLEKSMDCIVHVHGVTKSWTQLSNFHSVHFIREMQIKTAMRYHLTQVRTAIIKKSLIMPHEKIS